MKKFRIFLAQLILPAGWFVDEFSHSEERDCFFHLNGRWAVLNNLRKEMEAHYGEDWRKHIYQIVDEQEAIADMAIKLYETHKEQ